MTPTCNRCQPANCPWRSFPTADSLLLEILSIFDLSEFIYSAQVSSAIEGRFQKDTDDFGHLFFAQQVGRQTKDCGVIMSPGHIRAHFIMAQGGTHAANFISRYRHSYARAAEQDSPFGFSFSHRLDCRVGHIGIVAGFGGIGPEVRCLVSQFRQKGFHAFLSLKSPMICYPFKFYDNCLYSEGAAALILASEEKAREITDKPVWISGIGASLDYASMGNRYMDDPRAVAEFRSSIVAADVAYKMAGVKNPRQEIHFAELHDAFTGTEIMAYEDCGFCPKGEGGRLVDEGVVWVDGELPVNPSGGLLGMGHPVGATGIMQTVEAMLQLREEAGERQVRNARRGLVQSIGAVACAWTVAIVLEREG